MRWLKYGSFLSHGASSIYRWMFHYRPCMLGYHWWRPPYINPSITIISQFIYNICSAIYSHKHRFATLLYTHLSMIDLPKTFTATVIRDQLRERPGAATFWWNQWWWCDLISTLPALWSYIYILYTHTHTHYIIYECVYIYNVHLHLFSIYICLLYTLHVTL